MSPSGTASDEPRDHGHGRVRAESALAASEEQFRMLVGGVRDYAIFMLDPTGHVVTWNAGAERIKGYRADEIVGHHLSRFYPPEDVAAGKTDAALGAAARDGKYEEEGWRVRKDGTRFWASVVITALRDPAGRIRGFAKITRDITERRESARIRSIVDHVVDGIVTFDEAGLIESCNPAAEALFGYRSEEVLGRSVRLLAGAGGGTDWAAGAGARTHEVVGRRKDGTEFPMDLAVGGFHFQGRRAYTAVVRDATERRRVEEQRVELERHRNQLRVTLASIGDAVIATDSKGSVTFLNPVAERLTGWATGEASGRPLGDVFMILNEGTRRPVENPALRALRDGTVTGLANHTLLVARDGTERPIDDSAAPIRDDGGAVLGAVLVFRDVTDRHRLEDELQRRVAELAAADKRKDEFLAMLAHELRNPLAPVKNALHVLKIRASDGATVDQARAMMERQVGHLTRLVDDLLDVSRITQGKVVLKLERLDLARLVRESAADHRGQFEAARVALSVTAPAAPVWVTGDATRLSQVIDNFFTNALKFTNPGGEVAACVESEGGRAKLTVRDTGIGIEPEVLPTVFEVFAQADKTLDRSGGGLGLGLAIVRGLVRLHGGTVTAHSDGAGKGTEMVVTLPLESDQAHPATEAPPRPGAGGRHRVLIIEDNRDSAESLQMLLEASGYEVRLALTGPDGVREAAAWFPDAIVCDIGLPGMDGFAVARHLRGDPRTAAVRLVAVSGYGREEDVANARAAGFDDHLVKPADPEKLMAKLQTP
ncbi:two-component hybrid sensor and regulator : Chemotaxis protein methyltransferase CheR OS=Polaromonas naphthalenivorans (strain CJ2) PE=4 SV=1: PAS_9: PAS_9: PAS: HisKA: HATPase_c: Response_reg [Gemmataceae bacterium]|nr:two-component hybrid sensor and regulator : Chemotaxis protein methyltransferase CheR OS=Polaromonas naphthalenivorans (strain CJ2) PE=4 SV=1: PAS_9: PAS_9: PAS: HisKA: HATPase_c: Response_reg [Gemmataceae bacterium]VTT97626.1 two-component hybrid sensor and regulator : Chemotaxis protein methyltransferase CheR OS=Polaromonas naphthalenivorans (strain CJ2) PE=4 SV=1: PAS_9: PAS_9: PAS: HisKA: HATPase_c: Response_reg [Gemmataceae bacterium]